MELVVKHYRELSLDELYMILKARVAVFVVEQHCPYQEVDGIDRVSYHVWLRDEQGLAAYLRVIPAGAAFKEASLGRVLSLRRGRGYGEAIVAAGIRTAEAKYGPVDIRIEAQAYAQGFYEKAGFAAAGEPFLEDGIRHIPMLRRASHE